MYDIYIYTSAQWEEVGEAGEEESEGRKRVRGGRGRGEEEGEGRKRERKKERRGRRKQHMYVRIYHICLAADPGPTHTQCTDRNANTVSIHIHA